MIARREDEWHENPNIPHLLSGGGYNRLGGLNEHNNECGRKNADSTQDCISACASDFAAGRLSTDTMLSPLFPPDPLYFGGGDPNLFGLRKGFRMPITYAIFSSVFLSTLVLSRSESVGENAWFAILGYTFCSLLFMMFGSKKHLVLGLYSILAFLLYFVGVAFSFGLMFPQIPGDPQFAPPPFYSGAAYYSLLYFMISIILHGWFAIFSFESRNEPIGTTE